MTIKVQTYKEHIFVYKMKKTYIIPKKQDIQNTQAPKLTPEISLALKEYFEELDEDEKLNIEEIKHQTYIKRKMAIDDYISMHEKLMTRVEQAFMSESHLKIQATGIIDKLDFPSIEQWTACNRVKAAVINKIVTSLKEASYNVKCEVYDVNAEEVAIWILWS